MGTTGVVAPSAKLPDRSWSGAVPNLGHFDQTRPPLSGWKLPSLFQVFSGTPSIHLGLRHDPRPPALLNQRRHGSTVPNARPSGPPARQAPWLQEASFGVAESQHRLKIRGLTISGIGAHSVFFSACQIDIDARLSPSQPGEPPVAKPRHGRPRAGFFLALTRHFYGPSVLRRRHGTALVIDPGGCCHVLVTVWECAWGWGKPLAFGAARGAHGQRRQ